jgi:predicted HAD superfamily Cof-like phosphohydrolase
MSLVREFHAVYGHPLPDSIPCPPDPASVRLRARLIREEYEEVMAELDMLTRVHNTTTTYAVMARLLKELADLRYVVDGCALTFGLDIEGAFKETHRSNMSKLGADGKPIKDEGGKVLKGPNYSPADMTKFVSITDTEGEEL